MIGCWGGGVGGGEKGAGRKEKSSDFRSPKVVHPVSLDGSFNSLGYQPDVSGGMVPL